MMLTSRPQTLSAACIGLTTVVIVALLLVAYVYYVVNNWIGWFLSFDYIVAHIAGGGMFGDKFWHAGDGFLGSHLSPLTSHWIIFCVALVITLLLSRLQNGDWLDIEKTTVNVTMIDFLLVVGLELYRDYGYSVGYLAGY